MTASLDQLREAIRQNRAAQNSARPMTSEKTVFVDSKGQLLMRGEVLDSEPEQLSVVQPGVFAA